MVHSDQNKLILQAHSSKSHQQTYWAESSLLKCSGLMPFCLRCDADIHFMQIRRNSIFCVFSLIELDKFLLMVFLWLVYLLWCLVQVLGSSLDANCRRSVKLLENSCCSCSIHSNFVLLAFSKTIIPYLYPLFVVSDHGLCYKFCCS